MAKKPLPCPTLLRLLLNYDPDSGELFWKPRRPWMFVETRARDQIGSCNNWNSIWAGKRVSYSSPSRRYKQISFLGYRQVAHRVAWAVHHGCWPVGQIDHIDGVRGNNAISNLREVSQVENGRNQKRPVTNTSGHVGVVWHKGQSMWNARIGSGKNRINLGSFANYDDAVAARKLAEIRLSYHRNHGRD